MRGVRGKGWRGAIMITDRVSAAAGECTAQEVGAYATEKWIWAPPKSIRTQGRWPCRLAACTRTHAVLRIRPAPPPSRVPRPRDRERPPMTYESRPHSKEDIKTSLRPRAPARERMARAPRLRQKCLVRNGRSQPDDRRVDVHVGAGGREADAVLLLLLVPQRPGVASRGEQGATTGAIRPPAPTHQSCRVLVAHRPTLCGRRGGAAGVCTL